MENFVFNNEENEEIYDAVAFLNNVIVASSNGGYDFAVRTAKYYRSIGYSAKVMKHEDFINLLEEDTKTIIKNKKILNGEIT